MYSERNDTAPRIIPPSDDDLDSPKRINQQLAEGVQRGQLWLADYHGTSLYVLIAQVNDDSRMATVIPLSTDMRAETSDSLIISDTPLEQPMLAWPKLATVIPVRFLYKPLKEFNENVTRAIVDNNLRGMGNRGDIKRGTTHVIADNVQWETREDALAVLIQWHAACFNLPKLHGDVQIQYGTDSDLAEYTQALQTVLHLSPAQRIALSRGTLQLTAEQQQQMAAAGFAAQPQAQTIIGDDYLIMAEQPQWRKAADALERMHQGDPRVQLAHKAQFELAARVSGHGQQAIEGALQKAAEIAIDEASDTHNEW